MLAAVAALDDALASLTIESGIAHSSLMGVTLPYGEV